jgi:hypothetical protein
VNERSVIRFHVSPCQAKSSGASAKISLSLCATELASQDRSDIQGGRSRRIVVVLHDQKSTQSFDFYFGTFELIEVVFVLKNGGGNVSD